MLTATKQCSNTIKVSVAVEKVWVTHNSYTFRSELVEVEPVVIMRRTCGSYGAGLRRFYYEALVRPPAQLSQEYGGLWNYGQEPHLKQLLRVSISRTLNPKWKPPVFTDGKHVVDLATERAAVQRPDDQANALSEGDSDADQA